MGICWVSFIKDDIFRSSRFFLTTSDSYGTLHLSLGLIDMHYVAVSVKEVMMFPYLSFSINLSDIS